MNLFYKLILFSFFLFVYTNSDAQFAPAVGQPGTSAMYKDSSAFIDWVSGCEVIRGYQNISNTSAGFTNAGDSSQVFGIAGSNGVVSLGDGGSAICSFWTPISNGPGFDFAVFENSFNDNFLELAFVEVSNDGIIFYRFPSTSFIQDTIQISTFDTAGIPEKLNNLAGKYRALYGTPFDLEELNGTPGLDINFITHIRIIDVVGSIDTNYCSFDQYGNKINDPWPTEFPTGGFDLEAIGVINNWINSIPENKDELSVNFYPNPATNEINIISNENQIEVSIYNLNGNKIIYENKNRQINISNLEMGIYFVEIGVGGEKVMKKLINI